MKNGMLNFEWSTITSHNFKRDRRFDLFHFVLSLSLSHFLSFFRSLLFAHGMMRDRPETRPNAKSLGYNGVHVGCKYYAQVMQSHLSQSFIA